MTTIPRSRLRPVAFALLVLGLAVAAERQRWFPLLLGAATTERVWIWVASWPREVTPRAFLLARDFDVERAPRSARLEVAADPEYLVRLNGVRVGSGVYRPGGPVDVYEVGPALRRGRNRLLLELRSPLGCGGATLRLASAGGDLLVASDGDWRVFPASRRSLRRLDAPLPAAPRVAVLGSSPLARWGLPAERERALFRDEIDLGGPWPAARWRAARAGAEWRPLPLAAAGGRAADEVVEVDFGGEVAGYLHLDLAPRGEARGMLFYATASDTELDGSPDRVVVAVPRLGFWQDAEPARFRYVTVIGLESLVGLSVVPLRAEAAARLAAPAPLVGVLGVPMEPARSPLVEDLRRRLLTAGEGAR